jgi:hypothetical protein
VVWWQEGGCDLVKEEEGVEWEGVLWCERGFRGDGEVGEDSGFMVQLPSASLML